jgi:hypothetical protein
LTCVIREIRVCSLICVIREIRVVLLIRGIRGIRVSIVDLRDPRNPRPLLPA